MRKRQSDLTYAADDIARTVSCSLVQPV